ncbi:MAG: stage III sporulation AC/AD family protein [Candidatus Faecousia sp.]|nr:stage III sporulation AC/AD family protein [Eubacteriales bacterium]MDY6067710.1 stage III sporulation AC/AD family protein [Candidatus Faecousia sp.]
MELYFKGAAGILLAAVLGLALQKQEKDLSAVLTAAVIAMAAVLMLRLLEPVTELLRQLEQVGNLRSDALELLLKAAGIGLTAEVAGLVCADAGNAALAKMLRLLGTAAILCLSVPMFTALLECITEMVGYG